MKIPSLFKTKCKNPRTLSFRASERNDDMIIKTVNSVFFDLSTADGEVVETPESWFTNSTSSAAEAETASFSTELSLSEDFDGESLEMVVKGVIRSSERLFFEPNGDTNSILEEAKPGGFPFKGSVVMAMDSKDPYVDFRRSMEEMVKSHGVTDWECLEELLGWYLRVNGKKNHGFIVGAFVDLLLGNAEAAASASDNSTSFSSAVSSFSSSSAAALCSFEGHHNVIDEEETMVVS